MLSVQLGRCGSLGAEFGNNLSVLMGFISCLLMSVNKTYVCFIFSSTTHLVPRVLDKITLFILELFPVMKSHLFIIIGLLELVDMVV